MDFLFFYRSDRRFRFFKPGHILSFYKFWRSDLEFFAAIKKSFRAALERLEAEGYVRVSARQGIVVRAPSRREVAEQFELPLLAEIPIEPRIREGGDTGRPLMLQDNPGDSTAMAARKIRAKAQMIAAYLLEVHDNDVEFDVDRFAVKGAPEKFKTMKEIAFAAYNQAIPGIEPGLEAVSYYDPPNMTYPFGAYICVLDIDVDTGEVDIRRFYALDDCGTRINPMISAPP